jgi:F-type H+-transporting ATPase subunit gamma
MVTLREIRQKLHSVENIQKITQAMELVAASRLRRSQTKTENARPYLQELKAILNQLLLASTDLDHPLIQDRGKNKIGVVVVAGDKGLCGGYNHSVFSTAEKFLKNHHTNQVELILVGQKTINHFTNKKWNVRQTLEDWGGKITFEGVKSLTYDLINAFLNKELDEIWIVYTNFQNLTTRKVVVEKFLNIDIPQPTEKNDVLDYIFEPTEQEIFAEILPRYCISKLQLVLNEAFTSELAARILAMRAATKNADEMIEDLTLIRNKVRQTGITRELIEITSGAEHLKALN